MTGREGLAPGQTSRALTVRSQLGYTGIESRQKMLENQYFVDAYVRVLATKYTEQMGQPVVVDNRTGGSFVPPVQAVATAAPDGHTLLLYSPVMQIAKRLQPSLPFDPVAEFVPVAKVYEGSGGVLLVPKGALAANVPPDLYTVPVDDRRSWAFSDIPAGATVTAMVIGQDRGTKTISFKYRPKARSRITKGHRQELHRIKITEVAVGSVSAKAAWAAGARSPITGTRSTGSRRNSRRRSSRTCTSASVPPSRCPTGRRCPARPSRPASRSPAAANRRITGHDLSRLRAGRRP